MRRVSRRNLAQYAAQALQDGTPSKEVAARIVAELSASKRLQESELLVRDIAEILETTGKLASITIESARPLSKQLQDYITASMQRSLAVQEVEVELVTNPALLGGAVITSATTQRDMSIQSRLRQLKTALK